LTIRNRKDACLVVELIDYYVVKKHQPPLGAFLLFNETPVIVITKISLVVSAGGYCSSEESSAS